MIGNPGTRASKLTQALIEADDFDTVQLATVVKGIGRELR